MIFVTPAYPSSTLHKIVNEITSLKHSLVSSKNKYVVLQHKLKKSEISIGKLSEKTSRIEDKIKSEKNSLYQLQDKQQRYKSQLILQQKTLAKQIRAVYMLGHQPYLKLLLNQPNPNNFSRMLMYYHYVMYAQMKTMKPIQLTISKLSKTTSSIQSKLQALQIARKQLAKNRAKLNRTHKERKIVLQKLAKHIKSNKQKLQTLLADKRQLEQVVVTVSGKKMTIPLGTPFRHLRGKLAWPTRGRVIEHFGDPIYSSEIHWQGILIQAKTGQNVNAIASGRVVFANWMPGFGLLLIVQHDHGYMTIYGHNKSLYKNVGDTVKPGELLATVGTSGGTSVPALYFAIRHNSKALNPLRWLS